MNKPKQITFLIKMRITSLIKRLFFFFVKKEEPIATAEENLPQETEAFGIDEGVVQETADCKTGENAAREISNDGDDAGAARENNAPAEPSYRSRASRGDKAQLSISLSAELLRQVDAAASAVNRSRSNFVARVMEDYLNRRGD